MTFLDGILERKRREVEERRSARPERDLAARARAAPPPRSLAAVLSPRGGPVRVVAEVKRASPSAGALRAGLDVDRFAGRLCFFCNAHNNVLEEVAKFRAARRIWARTLKERFGARKRESLLLRTHAQTAGVSLTAQQPYNNVVRTALQAFAAVLGGTQSLHTNSLDETYALPTEEAVTIALRTQQIIAAETGVRASR